jgi:ketosteroid isomerase-like protein
LIRRTYAAWNRGDVEELLGAMNDDVEIRPVLGDLVPADTFRGHAGVRQWYETVTSTLEGFRVDIEQVIEASTGRYLIEVRFSGRGKSSGAPVTLEAAHLITMRSGLATELTGYPGWSDGLRAAGIANGEG